MRAPTRQMARRGASRRAGSGWLITAVIAAVTAALILAGIQIGSAAGTTASRRLTVKLAPVSESGIGGRVRFEARDGLSLATVSLTGPADGGYLVNLRRGTCLAYGALPEVPLGLVKPGEPVRTAVETPLVDLRNGQWVVAVHDAGNLATLSDPASAVACGKLKAIPSADNGSQAIVEAPAAGIGEAARRAGGERTALLLAMLGLTSLACGLLTRHPRRTKPFGQLTVAARGGFDR